MGVAAFTRKEKKGFFKTVTYDEDKHCPSFSIRMPNYLSGFHGQILRQTGKFKKKSKVLP